MTCPETSRWLGVAAGTERPEISAGLTEHAANCPACAGQLREALRLLMDDEDPAEARLLEDLESSQAGWQKKMAQRLSGAETAPAPNPGARRTWSWNLQIVGALAAAALLLVVVSQAVRRSSGPVAPVKSQPGGAPEGEMGQVTLESGTSRGLNQQHSLTLTSVMQTAEIVLHFHEAPPHRLMLKLTDSAKREIWAREVTLTDPEMKQWEIKVPIAAKLLLAGDYDISADEVTSEGGEHVSDFSLNVRR